MQLADVECFRIPPRWLLVRIRTTDGGIGWGEAIVPKRHGAVAAAIEEMEPILRGTDLRRIEEITQRCRRGAFFRGGPVLSTATAAIEHALWDLKGRSLGVPVHEMLGGRVRDRTRAYAWIAGDRPDDVVAGARRRVAQGFDAVKMNATAEFDLLETPRAVDAVVERVAALRDAFGSELDIALDFHGRVHRAMVPTLLRELEPYRLLWVEEPVAPGLEECLPEILRGASGVRIATGERLASRWEFRELLRHGAVDVLQPDVSLTGLFELEKIARMAEAYDVPVVPHCPNGPVSLAASLQVAACCVNIPLHEQSLGMHYNNGATGLATGELLDYVADPETLTPVEGYLGVSDGPGLGIEIDEDAVRARARENAPHVPDVDWRLPDGRITEW